MTKDKRVNNHMHELNNMISHAMPFANNKNIR